MTSEKDDLELINKLLEIYDQKYLGEYLNQVSPGQWCRETINRWVKGKASPRLSHREFEALPLPSWRGRFFASDCSAGDWLHSCRWNVTWKNTTSHRIASIWKKPVLHLLMPMNRYD